ncbi:class I SAM-dependent methyltransferase [Rhizobium sp. 32-5/1]|uniref:class I SAM-dependent methyltransferase n=1 Tax=Rhizobium sp. 32-5/1 TaxID=3019602 RepID=UPI00240E3542|nr:class I SAM-dependent methyltransferase [Rhizobium sp. 32-5/1]WEZ82967.1 class I SAM-dependent methyltransferase [Rhizobium sp. 32-5/1]
MKFLDKLALKYLKARGHYIPHDKNSAGISDFFLYDYKAADGTFDYERYRKIQEDGNKRKINNVWADQQTIDFIADYVKKTNPDASRGLCHGVRRGNEQKWFSERLGIEVIGTDISETAKDFPNTVQWDFHERNPDWVSAFDFVYTNSHDHAYDPQKAIEAWIDQLKSGGAVFLEHTMAHSEMSANEMDPFGVDPRLLPFLIARWSQGRYAVTEVLEPPHTKSNGMRIWIFVIRKTEM